MAAAEQLANEALTMSIAATRLVLYRFESYRGRGFGIPHSGRLALLMLTPFSSYLYALAAIAWEITVYSKRVECTTAFELHILDVLFLVLSHVSNSSMA